VKRALATGMTRDGTFLIEDGAIVGPVKNLRFNQDILAFLASIEQLGAQELVSDSPYSLMPAVLALDFQFTSTTGF
jgi:predicted Zn-dependent protease